MRLYWKLDTVEVSVVGASDEGDTTSMECNGQASARDPESNAPVVTLPGRAETISVECTMNTGQEFSLGVAGLRRDSTGELLRTAESEALITKCRGVVDEDSFIEYVWAPGAAQFSCPVDFVEVDARPEGSVIVDPFNLDA